MHLSIHPSSIYLCIYPSIHPFMYVSIHLSISLSLDLPTYLNKFDTQRCISLRCKMCYFDKFVYCNMIADVVIFINCIIIIQYLVYIHYTVHLYGLFTTRYKFVPLNTITLTLPPSPILSGNHRFTVFYTFNFFRFHI